MRFAAVSATRCVHALPETLERDLLGVVTLDMCSRARFKASVRSSRMVSRIHLVHTDDVSVKDRNTNRSVAGLKKEDFLVYEDGLL